MATASLLALAFVGAHATARAQDVDYDRLDVRGFWVADTASEPWRPVRLAYPSAGGGWDAGLMVDVARNPLMESLPSGERAVVDTMASAHAYGGVAWRGMRFETSIPTTLYGHDLGGGFTAAGDLRLGALIPAWEPEGRRPGLGIQASTWLPTGTASRWSGSAGVAAGAVACVGQEIGNLGWTANAGLRVAQADEARNLRTGSGPIGGAEVHWRVADALAVGAGIATQGSAGLDQLPIEATTRLRYRMAGGGFAIFGYAQGIGDAVGSSAGRIFFGVGYGKRPPTEPPPAVVVPMVITQREVIETVERDGEPVAALVDDRIVVSQQVFFEEARSQLLPESDWVLQAVMDVLAANPDVTHLMIEGHTNSRGSRRYNRRLASTRTSAVLDWFAAQGVDADVLFTKSFGEDYPLVPDSHPDAMVVNRRVEFKVLRSDEDGVEPIVPDRSELPAAVRNDQ